MLKILLHILEYVYMNVYVSMYIYVCIYICIHMQLFGINDANERLKNEFNRQMLRFLLHIYLYMYI